MSKNKVDEAVLELLTKVREKKAAIKAGQKKPQWKTNCSFSSSGTQNSSINIQTVRSEDVLVNACAVLMSIDDYMEQAAALLGLEYNNQYNGYHVSEWIDDFKTRAQMLKIEKEQKEVDALDARINKLVSAEQRREMELQELTELLK